MTGDRFNRERTDAASDRGGNFDQTGEAGILADEISDAALEAVALGLITLTSSMILLACRFC